MATLPIGPHRVEEMLKYCVDLAKRMLEANGEFGPFGAIIDGSGDRKPVAVDLGTQAAKAEEIYQFIANSMSAQYAKREIVAGAIVAEASIPAELKPDFPHGVRIQVESASISRLVFLPFKKAKPEAGIAPKIEYGELLGVNVRPSLFIGPLES